MVDAMLQLLYPDVIVGQVMQTIAFIPAIARWWLPIIPSTVISGASDSASKFAKASSESTSSSSTMLPTTTMTVPTTIYKTSTFTSFRHATTFEKRITTFIPKGYKTITTTTTATATATATATTTASAAPTSPLDDWKHPVNLIGMFLIFVITIAYLSLLYSKIDELEKEVERLQHSQSASKDVNQLPELLEEKQGELDQATTSLISKESTVEQLRAELLQAGRSSSEKVDQLRDLLNQKQKKLDGATTSLASKEAIVDWLRMELLQTGQPSSEEVDRLRDLLNQKEKELDNATASLASKEAVIEQLRADIVQQAGVRDKKYHEHQSMLAQSKAAFDKEKTELEAQIQALQNQLRAKQSVATGADIVAASQKLKVLEKENARLRRECAEAEI